MLAKVPVTCHDCNRPRKAHPSWLAAMLAKYGFYVCFDCGIERNREDGITVIDVPFMPGKVRA